MEKHNSTISLNQIIYDIVTNNVDVNNFLVYINSYVKETCHTDVDNKQFLIALLLYKKKTNLSPLEIINIDAVLNTFILNDVSLIVSSLLNCESKNITTIKGKNENNRTYENGVYATQVENYKNYFLNKYKKVEKVGNMIFPEPGEIGNVIMEDDYYAPGVTLIANLEIDHDGNVLGFCEDPYEKINPNEYEDIYAGLLGQVEKYKDSNKT